MKTNANLYIKQIFCKIDPILRNKIRISRTAIIARRQSYIVLIPKQSILKHARSVVFAAYKVKFTYMRRVHVCAIIFQIADLHQIELLTFSANEVLNKLECHKISNTISEDVLFFSL